MRPILGGEGPNARAGSGCDVPTGPRSSRARSQLRALPAVIAGGALWASGGVAQEATRFESEILAFERADLANPPPASSAVFTGSSSIRGWPGLAGAFPPYAVLNRGFGGSEMSDLLYYFDRVVAVYQPAFVIVYEGDNDLAGGKSVEQVIADYRTFRDRAQAVLPGTGVGFLAVKPSPSREAYLDAQRAVNAALAAMADEDPGVEFIDVFTPMLDADGRPRAGLFQSDMLHMNATGYAIWTALVAPVLDTWMGKGTDDPDPVSFTREPQDQTVEEFHAVTFEAGVRGTPPVALQWLRDGQPVAGARLVRLTLDPVSREDDGAAFALTASNRVSTQTSATAVLRVVPDVTPPVPLSVASPDGRDFTVTFSERVDAETARQAGAYRLNGGAAMVTSAVVGDDGDSVVLSVKPSVQGVFTLTFDGVTDRAGNPVASGTTLTGEVMDPARQPWLFDFGATARPTRPGPAPDDPTFVWNNVTDAIATMPGGRLLEIVNRVGRPTDASLIILRRFNGANQDGASTGSPFPGNAAGDSLFGNTEPFGGLSNVFPAFRLSRLDPALAYDFHFFASRLGVGDNHETRYSVIGAITATAVLDAANNSASTATVRGMRPTAAGEVVVTLGPSPANDSASHFTYLGALQVTPREPEWRLALPRIEAGELRLEWEGGGVLHWAPTIRGPWTPLLPAVASPVVEPLAPAPARFYRLQDSDTLP
ncbi:MAG: hypothetical protein H7A45_05115 [Verrucomicrobiales bacterium]|nr:hypothetical protein [Verrucomicrobiales bacterium]MCP5528555.1 hypothetical protein [Verrucomicrobiales bacterium]